MSIFIDSITIL